MLKKPQTHRLKFFSLLFISLCIGSFSVADKDLAEPVVAQEEPVTLPPLLDVASKLAITVGLLGCVAYGLYYLKKQGRLSAIPFSSQKGDLQVVENKVLGNKQFLVVVQYQQEKFLLGVGPGKVDMLTALKGVDSDAPPKTIE